MLFFIGTPSETTGPLKSIMAPITISLSKLGHVLLGLKARHTPVELAAALGLEMREPDDCRGRIHVVAHCFLALLPMLEELGLSTFDALQSFQNRPAAPIDFSPLPA